MGTLFCVCVCVVLRGLVGGSMADFFWWGGCFFWGVLFCDDKILLHSLATAKICFFLFL